MIANLKNPSCCVTVDKIKALTMSQRRSYYDALRLAETAMGGIVCEPRFVEEKTRNYNPAGSLVDDLHTFLLESIDVLVKVTRDETPTDPEEAQSKAWIVLLYEAICSDSLPSFVAIAAQEAVAVADAEFDTRVGRK